MLDLVSALWKEVLGEGTFAPSTVFFEAGGTSLLIVRLANLIRERTGLDLPVVQLFEHPSLGAQDAFAEVGMAARAGFTRKRGLNAGPDRGPKLSRSSSCTWDVTLGLLSDWIVYEHRVKGRGAVPGTAWAGSVKSL
ncbi:MAG: acyl carrier protein [Chitinispirillaceae bacterium]